MTIAFDQFTPFASLFGGVLIGLAALFLMATNGRVMGISGILGGLFAAGETSSNKTWRLAFLAGTIAGPLILVIITGDSIASTKVAEGFWLMAAGLVVGLGTAIGSGCTSGHGICGLAYLSPRSLAAVMTFMATAFVTVFIIRHVM
ncbi:MAG: YeeE/YedE family protein [Candidatus Puniceispirillales bacterium]